MPIVPLPSAVICRQRRRTSISSIVGPREKRTPIWTFSASAAAVGRHRDRHPHRIFRVHHAGAGDGRQLAQAVAEGQLGFAEVHAEEALQQLDLREFDRHHQRDGLGIVVEIGLVALDDASHQVDGLADFRSADFAGLLQMASIVGP